MSFSENILPHCFPKVGRLWSDLAALLSQFAFLSESSTLGFWFHWPRLGFLPVSSPPCLEVMSLMLVWPWSWQVQGRVCGCGCSWVLTFMFHFASQQQPMWSSQFPRKEDTCHLQSLSQSELLFVVVVVVGDRFTNSGWLRKTLDFQSFYLHLPCAGTQFQVCFESCKVSNLLSLNWFFSLTRGQNLRIHNNGG